MLDILTEELTEKDVFTGPLPPIVTKLVETIPNQTIPERMKITIALSELTTFASQFRRNMHHWDGFELPVNAVSFIVAGSGEGCKLEIL